MYIYIVGQFALKIKNVFLDSYVMKPSLLLQQVGRPLVTNKQQRSFLVPVESASLFCSRSTPIVADTMLPWKYV